MAFMMPVMKNNYEIYPRSRKNSESLPAATGSGSSGAAAIAAARRRSSGGGVVGVRSRPVSRTVSESERGNGNGAGSGSHDSRHFLSASPPSQSSAIYSSSAPAGTNAFAAHHPRLMTTIHPMSSRQVRFSQSASQESGQISSRKSSTASCRSVASSTSSTSTTAATTSSDSGGGNGEEQLAHSPRLFGNSAFGKFHSKLVDKLKRKLKLKDADGNEDDDQATAIRSST